MIRIISGKTSVFIAELAILLILTACASFSDTQGPGTNSGKEEITEDIGSSGEKQENTESVHSAVDFDHELDAYVPRKTHYNFYFTY